MGWGGMMWGQQPLLIMCQPLAIIGLRTETVMPGTLTVHLKSTYSGKSRAEGARAVKPQSLRGPSAPRPEIS